MKDPTKNHKYKYKTKEIALAAAKKKKNRARRDRRHHAKQYLTVAQKKEVPQDQRKTGRTKEEKRNARKDYQKVIKRAKQQRRRRQAINRQIWKELRTGLPKMEEETTLSTQPANTVQDTSGHRTGIDYEEQKKAEQHWLAIGAEHTGTFDQCCKSTNRWYFIQSCS